MKSNFLGQWVLHAPDGSLDAEQRREHVSSVWNATEQSRTISRMHQHASVEGKYNMKNVVFYDFLWSQTISENTSCLRLIARWTLNNLVNAFPAYGAELNAPDVFATCTNIGRWSVSSEFFVKWKTSVFGQVKLSRKMSSKQAWWLVGRRTT